MKDILQFNMTVRIFPHLEKIIKVAVIGVAAEQKNPL